MLSKLCLCESAAEIQECLCSCFPPVPTEATSTLQWGFASEAMLVCVIRKTLKTFLKEQEGPGFRLAELLNSTLQTHKLQDVYWFSRSFLTT